MSHGSLEISNSSRLYSANKKTGVMYFLKKDWALYLLLVIPVLFYVVFLYLPMYGLIIAFKEFNPFIGFFGGDFVGFGIFREIFKMSDFTNAVRNTLVLNTVALIFYFPCPIILAIMLNELKKSFLKSTIQSLIYLPYFISWIIIGGMVYQILSEQSGAINILLKTLGLHTIPFLTNGNWWIVAFVGTLIWQATGYNAIVYLAAITGINTELYEAAIVDGCGKIRLTWHITLPCIKPVIVIMMILAIGGIMNIGFDRAIALYNPLVSENADVISLFIYRVGLQNGRYSAATAIGLFQGIINLVMLSGANFIAKKLGEDGVW